MDNSNPEDDMEDDAPELTDDFFARAEIREGDTVIRPAKGTLTYNPDDLPEDSLLLGAKVELGDMKFIDASGQDMPPEFMLEIAKAMQAAGVLKGQANEVGDGMHALDISFDEDGKMVVEMVPDAEAQAAFDEMKKERN